MDMDIGLLMLSFGMISVLYSSAGFGGGSSYLALLALMGISIESMRVTALLCNVIVVFGSVYRYKKKDLFDWSRTWPFVLLSIPFSFIGGRIVLEKELFLLILAVLLVFAAVLMLFFKKKINGTVAKDEYGIFPFGIGALIGLMSGIVGIGGGVFLAPILYLSSWASARRIAATTSFFILANSISGIMGMMSIGLNFDYKLVFLLGITVWFGAWLGNRLTLSLLTERQLRILVAVLIGFAGVRILYQILF